MQTGADVSRFILNGLRHANRVLGETAFVERDWKVIGEYVYDAEGGRHQAFYAPRRDTTVMGKLIRPHERVQVEQSLKYSAAEAEELWTQAGMTEIRQWRHRREYGRWLSTPFALRVLGGFFAAAASCFPHTPRFPWHVGAVIRHPRVSDRNAACRHRHNRYCPAAGSASAPSGPAYHLDAREPSSD